MADEKAPTRSKMGNLLKHFTDSRGFGILSPARYDILIAGELPFTIGNSQNYSQHFDPMAMGNEVETPWSDYNPQYSLGAFSNVDAMRRLSESCEIAAFPGRNISSQPNRIHGPVRELPYEGIYSGDLDLTFRVGKDMFERMYFEFWMDTIVNHKDHGLSYYDEYTRDIYISQLDKNDNVVYKVLLKECWPKTLNPIEVGAARVDEYIRQSVSIAFREYEVIKSTNIDIE